MMYDEMGHDEVRKVEQTAEKITHAIEAYSNQSIGVFKTKEQLDSENGS